MPPKRAAPWCQGQGYHLFCDDFDEAPATDRWDGLDQQHGLTKLDDAAYTSPPYSFLTTTTALERGATGAVRVGKLVVQLVNDLDLAFDVRADELDSSGAKVEVCEIQLIDTLGETIESVGMSFSTDGITVDDHALATDDGGPDFLATHPISVESPLGSWMHVDIEIEFADDGSPGGALTVAMGNPLSTVVDRAPMSPKSVRGNPFLMLGIVTAIGPAEAAALRFDDLTFSAHF